MTKTDPFVPTNTYGVEVSKEMVEIGWRVVSGRIGGADVLSLGQNCLQPRWSFYLNFLPL